MNEGRKAGNPRTVWIQTDGSFKRDVDTNNNNGLSLRSTWISTYTVSSRTRWYSYEVRVHGREYSIKILSILSFIYKGKAKMDVSWQNFSGVVSNYADVVRYAPFYFFSLSKRERDGHNRGGGGGEE